MPYIGNKTSKFKTADELTVTGDANVTGTVTADGVSLGDNEKVQFGADNDLQIYHDGSNSYVHDAGTGGLYLRGSSEIALRSETNENIFLGLADGAAYVYHNGSAKLATTSTGIDVTGTVTMDGGSTSADFSFGDNDKALFGASDDLEIYHSGTASHIKETGTGNLKLEGSNIELNNGAGTKTYILATDGGAVQLRYNDTTKIETTSSGVSVTGDVTTGAGDGTLNARIVFNGDAAEGDGWIGVPNWNTDALYIYVPNGTGGNRQGMSINDSGQVFIQGEGSSTKTVDVAQGTSKVWIQYDQRTSVSINDSYNVSSLTDVSSARARTAINNDMNNSNYAVGGICEGAGIVVHQAHPTASQMDLRTQQNNGSNFDYNHVGAIAHGDLA